MTLAHVHPGPGPFALLTAAASLSAAVVYVAAAARLRRRGDAWPRWRDASFTAGGTSLAWAVVGSLPGGAFTAHMVQHLIVGMAAPLLFVLARPLTLALRSLAPGSARRGLLALAHSRAAGWLVCPPLAALLDVGGLWLLYRTGIFAGMRHDAWLHAAVHVHVLAAGLLFTFAVCRLDPVRRRWSPTTRGATLLVAGAAHAVLAKSLYAAGPPGTAFTAADLHTGAQIMYYGGDLVEAALAVVLAASWYQTTGRLRAARGRARARRRPAAGAAPSGR
ncbi:cytochrome c oxidase assembly protein [Streptomyces sp. NRRL S-37]|uniref:cytochrome c oxidase assembly protein n=1 Tax=Streptomyces sp. NRRL S-37 TaxID=1463903 RepID=UPI0004C4F767|nr:cytochrome c oxidase assembly protein [Streptomyces sp. NRRL S-37]